MAWTIPEQGWRKGPWTPEEDKLLSEYVTLHGEGNWSSVSRSTGMKRSGKSCRLRWVNYLRPGLKKGQLTPVEAGIVIELHALWGNKWSTIARYLPGRTDNEIKNYWRTHFKKKDKSFKKQEKRKSEIVKQKPPPPQKHEQQNLQEDDMKTPAMSCEDTSDEKMTEAQGGRQGMFLEDRCLSLTCRDVASWLDTIREDDLWDGLWNLDNQQSNNMGHMNHCNMLAMQNQATGFSCGVDSNNFYNGGYNF